MSKLEKYELYMTEEDYDQMVEPEWEEHYAEIDDDYLKIKNKRDVLKDLRDTSSRVQRIVELLQEANSHKATQYKVLGRMLDEMIEWFDDPCTPLLPLPYYSGWVYEVQTTTNGVSLDLCHRSSLVEEPYEVDGQIFTTWVAELLDAHSVCKHIAPKYLTVSEYAELYGVEAVTVRQWIRRGKLRNAKKNGSEWMLSELSIPSQERKYTTGVYTRDNVLTELPAEYSFLSKYNRVRIEASEEEKGTFLIKLNSANWDRTETIKMTKQEREKFEYYLIGNASFQSTESWISTMVREVIQNENIS